MPVSPPTPAPDEPVATDADLGTEIDGRYRLLERIGLGGMGAVYRAEHLGMGRIVAVKVLRPELGAHADALARFEREAQAAARVSHKNVVAVSDFGVRADGSLYLVMEYLRGESLGERLDRVGRLPWEEAAAIARHVARGLAHAHERGVVHRDIKPDNVYLVEDEDDPSFAKIVDFGIARLGSGLDPRVTRAGLVIGTPAYLSPEQALGGELDGRSDVYSLAIVLYEMITGRTPFGDRDALAMLTAHAAAEPPTFAEVAPDLALPPGLEDVVRRALAKRKEDRFASAAELAAALDEVRGVRPTSMQSAVLPVRPSTALPIVALPMVGEPVPAGMLAWVQATFPWTRDRARVKKLALWGGGGLLVVGFVAAVSTAANPPPPGAAVTDAAVAAPVDAGVDASAAGKPTPAAVEPTPAAVPDGMSDAVKAALLDLEQGKTCAARKAAVVRLRELGDARAIPALRRARFRMRGGVLGLGDSNTNACLRKEADLAIEALSEAH